MSYKINIIGAGVSGLTTAVLLLKSGYEVQITADQFIHEDRATFDPDFASLYPAASILPHSIYGDDVIPTFLDSKAVFKHLYESQLPAVSIHMHYELFEHQKETPKYASLMDDVGELSIDDLTGIPHLNSTKELYGWQFNCYFVDFNIYSAYLWDQFKALGGEFKKMKLTADDIEKLDSDFIINCSGLGSDRLFNDSERLVHTGHTFIVKGVPTLMRDGNHFAYNYEPELEIYSTEGGKSQDLYVYSRSGEMLLGGSRQEGYLDAELNFTGEEVQEPYLEMNGIRIPEQVYTLNRELILNGFGIDLDDYSEKMAKKGYRYTRSYNEGLRIESETLNDKMIIHNYGNGGAGVTVSWGASLKALNLVQKAIGRDDLSIDQVIQLLR